MGRWTGRVRKAVWASARADRDAVPGAGGDAGLWAALAAAVFMSRRVPAVSVVLTVPLWALGDVSDAGSTSPQNAPFILITGVTCYLMGRRPPGTCAALLLFAASATALTASAALAPPAAVAWFTLTMYLLFFGVLPWLLGRYRRRHRKLVVSGWNGPNGWSASGGSWPSRPGCGSGRASPVTCTTPSAMSRA